MAKEPTPSEKQVDTPPSSWKKWLWDNTKLVTISLILAVFIRLFIAEPRFIPSPSMVPTLNVGDRLLVDKVSYRLHPPHQGDIVIFEPPPQLQEYGYRASQAFIKRVIGLPGQQIEVKDGTVYIDNAPLNEDYLADPPAYNMAPVTVPAGRLFVMGDNRNDSNDSHVWGFLPMDNLLGKALIRFWPLDKAGPLGHPTYQLSQSFSDV